jgi:hypothetical protein
MPAIVSTSNLNDAETAKRVRAAVEELFKKYPEDWRVGIRGGIGNQAWEIKVTASDGRKTWVHILRGEKSEDNVEAVVKALREIIAELPLNALTSAHKTAANSLRWSFSTARRSRLAFPAIRCRSVPTAN